MRAVVQRVSSASVTVDDEVVGRIDHGFLVLLGVMVDDGDADLGYIVNKVEGLRVFADAEGRMNLDVATVGGSLLVVSQFTIAGDCRGGRRPSWIAAARPEDARAWYERAIEAWRARGLTVATGIFQADMQVALVNDGPVTLLLDSRKQF
ncbi:MAG TPA: D-aminoacyl-tRNA deacylase [Luteitalea sp.]|nr:D-aminoacyl-tRNA deacylase [Luteitalea sp.]